MTDITAVAAASLAYGVTAITVSALGVEPQSLVYATLGAGVGTIAAPQLPRIRAVLIFVCIVGLCALGGTLIAKEYFKDSNLYRNLASGGLAAIFHPAFAILLGRLGQLVEWGLRTVGLK